ncbi:hypothetical protein [Neisseria animaloris]|uniref:hypothetical protein n=1 Tax=Neisseria animaloris TaxID=326522 RepID=UPI000D3040CE|nr:hypothetical protein [Neisseria animaloris]
MIWIFSLLLPMFRQLFINRGRPIKKVVMKQHFGVIGRIGFGLGFTEPDGVTNFVGHTGKDTALWFMSFVKTIMHIDMERRLMLECL